MMYIALLMPPWKSPCRPLALSIEVFTRFVMKGRIPVAEWPEELKHPEVQGVFVGGCVARGVGSRFRAKAHAHCDRNDPHRGWICFLSEKRLCERLICLHELAHIVTKEGHTKRWREYLLQIGGTLDEVPGLMRSYHPVPRKKRGTIIDGTIRATCARSA